MNVLDTQVGGTHYTDLPHQPLDLIAGLDLDFFQGNVVKYLTRYKFKGAPVEDLKKAADYCRKAHAYLYYRQLTDDYRTRATYGVEDVDVDITNQSVTINYVAGSGRLSSVRWTTMIATIPARRKNQ